MDKTQEIMQQVRRIEMQARRLVTATFAGQYRSGFRGQGLDFDDFREYMPGDEPRFIDWKVTARTGTPYVRKFHEEREQALLLAVDTSASMRYAGGGSADSKLEYAARIAAVLAFSAVQNGDKISLLLFGCRPHLYLPPAKGMKQCLRVVREILSASPGGEDDSMEDIATEIILTQRKPAMCFLISDFLMQPDKKAVGKLSFVHELIPLRINDPLEVELPIVGSFYAQDPESGEQFIVTPGEEDKRTAHNKAMRAHMLNWERTFTRQGIDYLSLLTHLDFMPELRKLFARRSRLFAR